MVLDATDEQGQPFTHHPRLFCPFHFMNEDKARRNVAFVEGHVVNQVLCMTTRTIRAGQELFVDYGKDVDRDHWQAKAPAAAVAERVADAAEGDELPDGAGSGQLSPPLPLSPSGPSAPAGEDG